MTVKKAKANFIYFIWLLAMASFLRHNFPKVFVRPGKEGGERTCNSAGRRRSVQLFDDRATTPGERVSVMASIGVPELPDPQCIETPILIEY